MSADNVTSFPSSGPPSKPKKRKAERVGLKFACGEGDGPSPNTLDVYRGLHGVCHAMGTIDGTTRNLDLYADLSIAACTLIEILEERMMLF